MFKRNFLKAGILLSPVLLMGCEGLLEYSASKAEKNCMQYGFVSGTDAMAKCIQREMHNIQYQEAEAAKRAKIYNMQHNSAHKSKVKQKIKAKQSVTSNTVNVFGAREVTKISKPSSLSHGYSSYSQSETRKQGDGYNFRSGIDGAHDSGSSLAPAHDYNQEAEIDRNIADYRSSSEPTTDYAAAEMPTYQAPAYEAPAATADYAAAEMPTYQAPAYEAPAATADYAAAEMSAYQAPAYEAPAATTDDYAAAEMPVLGLDSSSYDDATAASAASQDY